MAPTSEGSHHLLLLYMRQPCTQAPPCTQTPPHFCRESLGTRLYTDASSRQGRLHGTLPTTIEPEIFACGMGAWILSKNKTIFFERLRTIQIVSLHIQNFLCTRKHCIMNTYSALVVRLRSGVLPTITILREEEFPFVLRSLWRSKYRIINE